MNAYDRAMAQARADMDAEAFGVLPHRAGPPPLPPEFKHGLIYLAVLFSAMAAVYLLAGWVPSGFWSVN